MSVLHLNDPELIFYDNSTALDPCHGLTEFGPYGVDNYKKIRIGLIGSSESTLQVENLLSILKTKVVDSNLNKWPFPGLGRKSNLKFDVNVKYKEIFPSNDLNYFSSIQHTSRIARIKYALNLIESSIKKIADLEPKADVILISIPKEILKYCRSKKFKHTNRIYLLKRQFDPGLKNYKDGYNFHNIIKILGMDYGFPTQLIYPSTLVPNPKIKGRQDLAMIAWNLTVALLYKANEVPWKYFEFPDSTCFVGISFHKEFDDNDEQIIRASVAQTFLSNGRDIVLRGNRFAWDSNVSKNPHMSREYTIELTEKILSKYKEHWGRVPDRVVVHKSSEYWLDETKGFSTALRNVSKVDLINVSKSDVRFYRLEQQPVVRGTFINLHGKYYLYNVGYVPCLDEYPGARIPAPIEIKFHRNDEDKIKICQEIMALARLNWNNIDYSTKYPVTLTFSRNVGEILSEYRAKSLSKVPDKYRYYM
ncbi:MAG: hypothetical protein ACFFBI_10475 [Promethearchaeota archaeon]